MTLAIETTESLPRWDLDSLFPGPQSPELRAAIDEETRAIAELEGLFDRYGVGTKAPSAVDGELVGAFVEILDRYNAVLEAAIRLEGYFYCLVAADVRDEAADEAASAWRQRNVGLARLAPRFKAWVGQLDVEALIERSATARDHAPALRRIQTAAAHLMPPGEEDLAAALSPSAVTAWVNLRDELAGRATGRIVLDGEERELPLSEIEHLSYHEDRDIRRHAHDTTRETWRALAIPLAAALNGVKGQQLTLSRRRGWDNPLDQALFDNAIDRATFNEMQLAIREALPAFRRYLSARARLLGLPVLATYDMFAPVGEPAPWHYSRSQEFIVETFSAEHPKLGALAERAFADAWIDAEPREGKDGGGFSSAVGGDGSRIFLNYLPVYDLMAVLAHELGHSYHIQVVAEHGRTPLQSPPDDVASPLGYPMTLAETASTLCEALVQQAARKGATPAQETALLDGWLRSFSLLVFGTHAMFMIEDEVFAHRRQRELSPSELDEIASAAWRDIFGDAIDPDTIVATDWTRTHLFVDDLWYYNFPYAFGVLFAVGLLAVRDANPTGFYERFDDLLADSGMTDAAELAVRFGIDLRDPSFWRTSLDRYRAEVGRYEELAFALTPALSRDGRGCVDTETRFPAGALVRESPSPSALGEGLG